MPVSPVRYAQSRYRRSTRPSGAGSGRAGTAAGSRRPRARRTARPSRPWRRTPAPRTVRPCRRGCRWCGGRASMNSAEACTSTTAAVHSTRSRSMSYRRSLPRGAVRGFRRAAGDAGEDIGGALLAAGSAAGVPQVPSPGLRGPHHHVNGPRPERTGPGPCAAAGLGQAWGSRSSWARIRAMSSSALASRARILSTTWSGAFARNASLPSLAVGLRLLLLGRGEVLGQPLALGRDVDRAGQVQRDRGARDRQGRGGA